MRILSARMVILLCISVVLVVFWWSSQQTEDVTIQEDTPPLLSAGGVTTYSYAATGERDTQVESNQVTYFTDERGTIFDKPVLTTMHETVISVLRANIATQNATRTELFMQGNVQGTRTDSYNPAKYTQFNSDNARYFIRKQEATTNADVVITTPSDITTATGAFWQLPRNLFILRKNVRSHYVPTNHP